MGTLNQYGYQKTSYNEKIIQLQTMFQDAYGSDLDVSLYSPQGQMITFIATLWENEDNNGLELFQNMNYKNSTGLMLSLIAISKGQPRRDGTLAVIEVEMTSSATGYTITANSLFFLTNDNDIQFKLEADTPITTSPQTLNLIAVSKQRIEPLIAPSFSASW